MKKQASKLILCLTVAFVDSVGINSSAHSMNLFGDIFGKKDPHKKLSLLSSDVKTTSLSEQELSLNIAYVSPGTFKSLFPSAMSQEGYACLYNEYIKVKREYDIGFPDVTGLLLIKPHKNISKDDFIFMNDSLKTYISKVNKKYSEKDSELDLMPILDSTLDTNRYVKFDVRFKSQNPSKERLTIYGKTLAYQLGQKFASIPLTKAMNGVSFVFTKKDIGEIEGIDSIELTLKGYSGTPKILDASPNSTFDLLNESGFSINTYKEPNERTFKELILPCEKKVKKELLEGEEEQKTTKTSRKNINKNHEVMDLKDFLGEEVKSKELSQQPQIQKLNLNFEELEIGGLDKQLQELVRRIVLTRAVDKKVLKKLAFEDHIKGVLLHGVPGGGKTLIARTICKMLGVPEKRFKVINGPEILSKYVGESEKNIREIFEDAENNPNLLHIVFFDEFDAIAGRRTNGSGAGEKVNNNLVNQLLAKMDGVNKLNNIIVMGATNRLDMIDSALLRPGRFNVQLEIGLPDKKGRESIFNIHLKKSKEEGSLSEDVSISELVDKTQNYTGAEIKGVCDEARLFALRDSAPNYKELEKIDSNTVSIKMDHLLKGLEVIKPAFGQRIGDVQRLLPDYSLELPSQLKILEELQEQRQSFLPGKVSSILITGEKGSGKSAIAARFADLTKKDFDLTRTITPQLLKSSLIDQLEQAWQDAERVERALLILDDLATLLKILNDYKYDERGMTALNTILNSKTKGNIVVLATMGNKGYTLFNKINPMAEWSVEQSVDFLTEEDIQTVLKKSNLDNKELADELSGLSIDQTLKILSVEKASKLSLEDWQKRIKFLGKKKTPVKKSLSLSDDE